MIERYRVAWTMGTGSIERGPRTGPLPKWAANHLARNMRKSADPPREVRVIPVEEVEPEPAQVGLFG